MKNTYPYALYLGVLLLTGCASLPSKSSGQVGCHESEIQITNVSQGFSSKTWTAVCRGKVFYCTQVNGGQYSTPQITCKEELTNTAALPPGEHASEPQPTAGPDEAGCHFDTQCKGDRICVKGECVSPPAGPQGP